MSIYASSFQIAEIQDKYKKEYQTFRPYNYESNLQHYSQIVAGILKTQNGQDVDDYRFEEDNKIEKYLTVQKDNSKTRLLLLGVGSGRELQLALHLGFDAYGITLGSRNLDFGIDYLGLPKDRFIEGIAECLPFNDQAFDIVAGFQIFEHAISPLVFLLEIGRVLTNHGSIILEWPPPTEQFSMGDNPHHQICYLPGQAKVLLEKAGFKNIELFYENLEIIPKQEYWSVTKPTEQLVIKAIKYPNDQDYIKKAWKVA